MIALCVALGVLGATVLTRVWSGQHAFLAMEEPPRSWPWSGALWRGYVRALGILPVGWWLIVITVIVGRISPRHSWPADVPAAVLAAACCVVMLLVVPSILLLAAPQRLIPPAVRGQPGAVTEWRAARRHRGRAST